MDAKIDRFLGRRLLKLSQINLTKNKKSLRSNFLDRKDPESSLRCHVAFYAIANLMQRYAQSAQTENVKKVVLSW